jgi:hypothetical protein
MTATDFDEEAGVWIAGQLGQAPWAPPDKVLLRSNLATWFAPGEAELDPGDPVGDVLRRAGLHEVSNNTRQTLQRTSDRTADGSWERSSLLMSLALMAPEFARA